MENNLNENQLEFAIFCIENIALKLHKNGRYIYNLLTKENNILFDYIIPSYDVLHTQSKEYIIDDIIEYMQEKGVKI